MLAGVFTKQLRRSIEPAVLLEQGLSEITEVIEIVICLRPCKRDREAFLGFKKLQFGLGKSGTKHLFDVEHARNNTRRIGDGYSYWYGEVIAKG